MTDSTKMRPEKSIESFHQDEFEFGEIARGLASAFQTFPKGQSSILSIEGAWGSGKTGLLKLMKLKLKDVREDEAAPIIVDFEPWRIGSEDALLGAFFDQLSQKMAYEEGGRKTAGLPKMLADYGALLSLASPILGAAGYGFFDAFVYSISLFLKLRNREKSIEETYEKLKRELKLFDRQIIVVIDDLDRLEPREAAETIRLVKSVASLPNINYVLLYDADNLARSLTEVLKSDGTAFLEKIVQFRFRIPSPGIFTLRRNLVNSFLKYATHLNISDEDGRIYRLMDSIPAKLLRTPRQIVRTMNALKLRWTPISEVDVNFADMCWLVSVENTAPELAIWVEEYMSLVGIVAAGTGSLSSEDTVNSAKNLKDIFDKYGLTSGSLFELEKILPGISYTDDLDNLEEHIFKHMENQFPEFLESKGIGSPSHYSYYFSFQPPPDVLAEDEASSFLRDAADFNTISAKFALLLQQRIPPEMTGADALLDILNMYSAEAFGATEAENICLLLSNELDEAAHVSKANDWGRQRIWNAGELLLEKLIRQCPDQHEVLIKMFSEGRSIGWLMSVLRRARSAYNRGLSDGVRREWVMPLKTLNAATEVWIDRIKGPDRSQLADAPNLLNSLYGWLQSGLGTAEDDVKIWFAEQIESDEGFLGILHKCRGWRASNGGVSYPLKTSDLAHFTDPHAVTKRLEALAINGPTDELKAHSSELLKAIDEGDRF